MAGGVPHLRLSFLRVPSIDGEAIKLTSIVLFLSVVSLELLNSESFFLSSAGVLSRDIFRKEGLLLKSSELMYTMS